MTQNTSSSSLKKGSNLAFSRAIKNARLIQPPFLPLPFNFVSLLNLGRKLSAMKRDLIPSIQPESSWCINSKQRNLNVTSFNYFMVQEKLHPQLHDVVKKYRKEIMKKKFGFNFQLCFYRKTVVYFQCIQYIYNSFFV